MRQDKLERYLAMAREDLAFARADLARAERRIASALININNLKRWQLVHELRAKEDDA